MPYPPPPWLLQGYALQTLQLIDIDLVRPLIPPEFEIISLLPGKTLGGVYLSNYSSGSVLEYNELIVSAALVRYSGKIGNWISHIYVDNPDSVAGGREVFGLPKELAEFTWVNSSHAQSGYKNRIVVSQGEKTLCHLKYNQPGFGLNLPFSIDVFGILSDSILLFKAEVESCISLIGSQLQIPPESHFANLGLEQPWLTISWNQLRLIVSLPTVVGEICK